MRVTPPHITFFLAPAIRRELIKGINTKQVTVTRSGRIMVFGFNELHWWNQNDCHLLIIIDKKETAMPLFSEHGCLVEIGFTS